MSVTSTITGEVLQLHGLDKQEAKWFLERLSKMPMGTPHETWRWLSKKLLSQKIPFPLHQLLHENVYAGWRETEQGPCPVWVPSEEEKSKTNISALIPGDDFSAVHKLSVRQPEVYWTKLLSVLRIHFKEPPHKMLEDNEDANKVRWLPGAQMNIAESCFAKRRSGDIAMVWQNKQGDMQRMKRADMLARVRRISVSLRAMGFQPNDPIAVCMPLSADAVCLYLGIVWAGCVVVVLESSSATEVNVAKLKLSKAKAVFAQEALTPDAPRTVMLQNADNQKSQLRDEDLSWDEFLQPVPDDSDVVGYEPFISNAASLTHILFSKDAQGKMKMVPWTHITPIKSAADAWAHHDIQIGNIVAWPSSSEAVMAPWLIYASLLNGGTLALFEGKALERNLGEFVQNARVNILGVTSAQVKAWRSSKCMSGLDWSSIKCFSAAGGCSVAEDMHWLMAFAGYKPVIEYDGGLELGSGLVAGTLMQPQAPATFSTKTLGANFKLMNQEGKEATTGSLLPSKPVWGAIETLLEKEKNFQAFPNGYFRALN